MVAGSVKVWRSASNVCQWAQVWREISVSHLFQSLLEILLPFFDLLWSLWENVCKPFDARAFPGRSRGLPLVLELENALGASDIPCTLDGCSEAPWDQVGAGEDLPISWAMTVNWLGGWRACTGYMGWS